MSHKIEFLGRTPQNHKIQKVPSKRTIHHIHYIPRLSEKLLGFYDRPKAEKQIKITEDLVSNYKTTNAALAEACELAVRQPITGRQYVLMTDARFRAPQLMR